MGALRDLTGKRFGRLLVVDRAQSIVRGRIYITKWNVICDCGTKKAIIAASLYRGVTRSCGCLNRETSSKWMKNRHDTGQSLKKDAAFMDLKRDYRVNSRSKGRAISLSDEDFRKLFSGDCYYCGQPPSNVRQTTGDFIVWNGIDRVNSELNYISENCVSCCTMCNLMKLDKSQNEFIEHCKKVAKHNNS